VKEPRDRGADPQRRPYRVRLPGFLIDEEIGLGDVTKRATYGIGIKPCSGCEQRAAALNRWMVFSRSSGRGLSGIPCVSGLVAMIRPLRG
jgi:hypothetical protein